MIHSDRTLSKNYLPSHGFDECTSIIFNYSYIYLFSSVFGVEFVRIIANPSRPRLFTSSTQDIFLLSYWPFLLSYCLFACPLVHLLITCLQSWFKNSVSVFCELMSSAVYPVFQLPYNSYFSVFRKVLHLLSLIFLIPRFFVNWLYAATPVYTVWLCPISTFGNLTLMS